MTTQWSPDDRSDLTDEQIAEIARDVWSDKKMGPPPQPARVWVKASYIGELQARTERAETALDAVMAVPEMVGDGPGDRGYNLAVREIRAAVLDALGGLES